MSLIEEARAVRQRVIARLQELEPLAREYEELRRAAAELGIEAPHAPASATASVASALAEHASAAVEDAAGPPAPRRAPARRRAGNGATAGGPIRRRPGGRATSAPPSAPRGNGRELGERVLRVVHEQPGQTVADYARALNLAPAVLYRPVRELTTVGQLVKRNRQLYPG